MTSELKETSVTIQDESMKYMKKDRDDPSWAAQGGTLFIPVSNLNLLSSMRSTGTMMVFLSEEWG